MFDFFRRGVPAISGLAIAVVIAAPAQADGPENGRAPLTVTSVPHPLLDPDPLVTDQTEGNNAPLATCSYEQSVFTSPNPAPSVPSHQLVYFVPSDVAPNPDMDVPRSCSDGSVDFTNLSRTSRNFATWLNARNAGLNFRTLTIDYNHNYTGVNYSTRGVRRFVSRSSLAYWNSLPMYETVGGTPNSPRFDEMTREMTSRGWNVANTRYVVMMHAKASTTPCPHDPSVSCDVPGIASRPYAMTLRMRSNDTVIRYGCASQGDVFQAHETAHMVYPAHVDDVYQDLLHELAPTRKFTSSPSVHWDYNRDDYHGTVSGSVYVQGTGLGGSYFTC